MADDLHSLLTREGLDAYVGAAEAMARPSIRLLAAAVVSEDAIPLGASKLGGSPDLPADQAWPRCEGEPLNFIAQINFAEIAPYAQEGVLPAAGLISFFFAKSEYLRDWKDKDVWRVIFTPDADGALHQTPMPSRARTGPDDDTPYSPRRLEGRREMTIPHIVWLYERAHGLQGQSFALADIPDEVWDAYGRVAETLDATEEPIHRMLGNPDEIQSEREHLREHEVLLLQIDTDPEIGMEWADGGRLYWIMTEEDLARRDFSRLRFTWESA
jgi:uncharacterized protein YwqG